MAQSLVDYQQNNAPCDFECEQGEVRTCGNVCVTPVENGNACSQTDCASNSVCADPSASCRFTGSGYECVDDPNDKIDGEGGLTILNHCNDEPSGCDSGLWCRDIEECFPDTIWGGQEWCVVGAPSGAFCDSNWGAPDCFPCMPGSACVNGACHIECQDDEDCPCVDEGQDTDHVCDSGLCKKCRRLGEDCNEHTVCCDPELECAVNASAVTTSAEGTTCCVGYNNQCSSDGDCCTQPGEAIICLSSGVCHECVLTGGSCQDGHDCCSGYECLSSTHMCAPIGSEPDCSKVGKGCATGDPGICAKGHYVEDTQGGCLCVPDEASTSEVCNGKDDDCDGDTDEGLGITDVDCYDAVPTDYDCQDNFTTYGKLACKPGVGLFCMPIAGFTYCAGAACGGYLENGAYCGACFGHTCNSTDLPCAPNSECVNGYCSGPCELPSPAKCWNGPPSPEECE